MKKIMTIEIYTKETGRKRKEGEEFFLSRPRNLY